MTGFEIKNLTKDAANTRPTTPDPVYRRLGLQFVIQQNLDAQLVL